jgi:hypothetical protein
MNTTNTVVHMACLVSPVSLDGDHESDVAIKEMLEREWNISNPQLFQKEAIGIP